MPVAHCKPERVAKWDPRQDPDTVSIQCLLYSGHLLKLGSNDRWQSRLFTFDGSVLICVGKRPKAPVIVTYDPHVSSPFMPPPCSPHLLNPNTKWFINIASVADIKLLSTSRSRRCFPCINISKELSIRTNDGRTTILRASKDIELERWYFVLCKIWEYQLQMSKPEAAESALAARHLVAHQQSAQLFQKYLEKQYPEQDPQRQLHPAQKASSQHVRLSQKLPMESPLPYQIPPPPRVSAFLPQEFEWSLQEQGDEDDIPARFVSSFYESQSVSGDREHRSLERQTTWSRQRHTQGSSSLATGGIRQRDNLIRSSSAGMAHQRSDCHAANSMEPGKAAIIDNWRRSLLMPMLKEETILVHSGDGPRGNKDDRVAANAKLSELGPERDSTSDLAGPRTDSRDMESTLKHSSLGLDFGMMSAERELKIAEQDEDSLADNRPLGGRNLYAQEQGEVRNYRGNRRSSHLPGLTIPLLTQEKDQVVEPHPQDSTVKDLGIHSDLVAKEEDELPLGLIQAKRHSQWLNTQLSSEDGASATQRGSNPAGTPHRLLPSQPITPERTPAKVFENVHATQPIATPSWDMFQEHQPLDINGLEPSLSNPTLSLHGSSYSHLPIHDPDFVFPKQVLQDAYAATNNERAMLGRHVLAAAEPLPQVAQAGQWPISDRPLFSVQIPIRHLRRGLNNPSSSSNAMGPPDASSKKYVMIDTSPYTNVALTNPNHPVPPPRPMRTPEVTLSPLLSEPEDALPSMMPFGSYSSAAPVPASAIYSQQQPQPQYGRRPSLSRSISAMSSVSQVHHHHQSTLPQLSTPYRLSYKVSAANDNGDDDEDEPLAVAWSRHQSLRQQHRLSQLVTQSQPYQLQQQRRLSTASYSSGALLLGPNSNKNGNGSNGYDNTTVMARQHQQLPYGQAGLAASNESFSYF